MRESGKNRKIPEMDRTEQAVVALLTSPTLEEASTQLGVTSRTLRTWLHEDEALRLAYQDAKRQLMGHTLSRMQKITAAAVTRLETILENPEVKDAVAVGAARVVLDLALRAVVLEDLDQRITRVETELRKRKAAQH
jgi:hypothetical protein